MVEYTRKNRSWEKFTSFSLDIFSYKWVLKSTSQSLLNKIPNPIYNKPFLNSERMRTISTWSSISMRNLQEMPYLMVKHLKYSHWSQEHTGGCHQVMYFLFSIWNVSCFLLVSINPLCLLFDSPSFLWSTFSLVCLKFCVLVQFI